MRKKPSLHLQSNCRYLQTYEMKPLSEPADEFVRCAEVLASILHYHRASDDLHHREYLALIQGSVNASACQMELDLETPSNHYHQLGE